MATAYVLYNNKAGDGNALESVKALEITANDEMKYIDVSEVSDYRVFITGLEKDDYIILAGGDGTLNRFINGVGYGIDGYCCEVGDELKKLPDKKVNYTAIAINGLLFHYKPTNAKVTVDGKAYTYEKVWIAPTMNGRFYGGGMMPTPNQERNSGKLSTMVFHNAGKLKTLMFFPALFKGEHVKHTKQIEILTGNEITVEFDRPVALQIDGETILGVSSYTATISKVSTIKEKIVAANGCLRG